MASRLVPTGDKSVTTTAEVGVVRQKSRCHRLKTHRRKEPTQYRVRQNHGIDETRLGSPAHHLRGTPSWSMERMVADPRQG